MTNKDISQRGVKLLLISPQEEDHRHLHDKLRQSNWQPYGARTQKEAFAFLREHPTPVVLCECELPDGTWRDVLSQLGQMDRPPLLVVTSRFADDRLWAEVLNLGGYNVLAKPLDTQEIYHVIGLAWGLWKQRWDRPRQLALSA